MELLFEYGWRLLPGLILLITTYILLPKNNQWLKISLLLVGFILMRDAMTPVGLWEFGINGQILWLRFIDDTFILFTIALLSLGMTFVICHLNPSLGKDIKWFATPHKFLGSLMGIIAAIIIVLPFMLPYLTIPITERAGVFPRHLLLPLLIFALLGNLLEEVLFRGLLQNELQKITTKFRAILLSGLFFALGHIFLAITVTDLGYMVLVFTLYEGLICALLASRFGVIPASLAHGIAIFLLSTGIL